MLDRVAPVAGLTDRGRGQVALSGALLALDRALDRVFVDWAGAWDAVEYRFPACVQARDLDRLDYFRSFPHLATFPTTLDDDEANLERFAGAEPAVADGAVALTRLAPVRHVLTPAACYHVYVELEGVALDRPRHVTTRATCFRNERSYAPLERQWSFSMREIVCLGTAAEVTAFLERCTGVIDRFIARIGLAAEWRDATDPFFAPAKNPKYLFQRLEPVKRELVFDERLAIASTNLHHRHFGETFAISRAGEPAHSGCVAFGVERWLSAFLSQYGSSAADWPALPGVVS